MSKVVWGYITETSPPILVEKVGAEPNYERSEPGDEGQNAGATELAYLIRHEGRAAAGSIHGGSGVRHGEAFMIGHALAYFDRV